MNYDSIMNLVIVYLGILIVFIGIYKIFNRPLKRIMKLIWKMVVSTGVMFGVNFIISNYGLHIAINLVTCLIISILGLPGVALLISLA